eukprot:TRINITY_DN27032_c0_g1_i1.p1 TRINITY_DN27032_c0_g1~~TRINITY_DN27032_c0_g1_i1.p1  ORF type:complete len:968 (+),score=203.56 TRINITY_DN27032_c0_g1_i1:125-3028(+)
MHQSVQCRTSSELPLPDEYSAVDDGDSVRQASKASSSMPSLKMMHSASAPGGIVVKAPQAQSPRQASHQAGSKAGNHEAINVVVRFRPSMTEEELQDWQAFVVRPGGRGVDTTDFNHRFDLDRAFGENISQAAVYDYVGRPLIGDVLDGYNGTIFAYGISGGGKTHCMFGPGDIAAQGLQEFEQDGIVPRAAREAFDYIEARVESQPDQVEFTLRCSFLEVYREQMRDLLNPLRTNLRVKELPRYGLYVDGLTREYVTCKAEVMHLMRVGNRCRCTSKTRLNQHSSRSHAVFVLQVEQRATGEAERLGKLTLVDLAGSEKVSKSGSIGETLEDAKKINVSLSALGKVIDALAEQRPHVPYRDSKLTRVLEEALGGNCRTTLLVAASAHSMHFDETLSSLRFATRAKKVQNRAKVNYLYSPEQLLPLVVKLQRELLGARTEIARLTGTTVQATTPGIPRFLQGRKPSKSQSQILLPGWLEEEREDGSSRAGSKNNATMLPASMMTRQASTPQSPASPTDSSCAGGRRSSSRQMWGATADEDQLAQSSACNTSRSRSVSSDEDPDRCEAAFCPPRTGDGEEAAWRPVALAARGALRCLEDALMAQESALEEARLLARTKGGLQETDTTSSSSLRMASDGAISVGLLEERFNGLRHAVEARGLRWRLQLQRHRNERLALELSMWKRHAGELGRSLEARSSAGASLDQADETAAGTASPSARSVQSGVLGCNPRSREYFNTSKAFAGDAPSSPSRSSTKRLTERGGAAASSKASTKGHSVKRMSSGDLGGSGEAVCWNYSGVGSFGAGTHGDDGVSSGARSPLTAGDTGGSAVSARRSTESAQLRHTPPEYELVVAEAQADKEHAVQAQRMLRDRIRQLERELSAREVHLSSLRHEVSVKDALLRHVCEENARTAERGVGEAALERLLEDAMAPLAALLKEGSSATGGQTTVLPADRHKTSVDMLRLSRTL